MCTHTAFIVNAGVLVCVCACAQAIASMDSIGSYNPADAAGFIQINAHRVRAHTYREVLKKQA